ncbi:UNVERIFIED_CONTAM: hypothetical protein HDU68_005885, partial [Siphonaria sp. JEL0065]
MTTPVLSFVQIRSQIEGGDVEAKRTQLQTVLSWLCSDGGSGGSSKRETDVAEAVSILQTKSGLVPGFAASAVAQLVTAFVRIPPKSVEVFPSLLAVLAKDESPIARDAATQCLIKAPWPPQLVGALALAFADLVLAQNTHEMLVTKLVKCMQEAQLAHLPNIVRFLLVQAKAGQRKKILEEILDHMNILDLQLGNSSDRDWQLGKLEKQKTDVIRMEGTLILQICFAVRQNQDLGAELLTLLKAGKRSNISPFSFSLLLAMSQIHRFETTALDALKSIATSSYKDFENCHNCKWVPAHAKEALAPVTIWNALHRIILKSEYWDNLAPELCNFAFILIESSGVATAPAVGNHMNRVVFQEFSHVTIWGPFDLGSWALLELCNRVPAVIKSVVDQILSRIMTKPINILTYSYIFEQIARKGSGGGPVARLSQFGSKILEVLNCLGEVPVQVCERFLWCIKPLFQSGSNF